MTTKRPSVDPKVFALAEIFINGQIDESKNSMAAEVDLPDNLCARLIQYREDNTWNLAGEIQTTIEDFLNGLEN